MGVVTHAGYGYGCSSRKTALRLRYQHRPPRRGLSHASQQTFVRVLLRVPVAVCRSAHVSAILEEHARREQVVKADLAHLIARLNQGRGAYRSS